MQPIQEPQQPTVSRQFSSAPTPAAMSNFLAGGAPRTGSWSNPQNAPINAFDGAEDAEEEAPAGRVVQRGVSMATSSPGQLPTRTARDVWQTDI